MELHNQINKAKKGKVKPYCGTTMKACWVHSHKDTAIRGRVTYLFTYACIHIHVLTNGQTGRQSSKQNRWPEIERGGKRERVEHKHYIENA